MSRLFSAALFLGALLWGTGAAAAVSLTQWGTTANTNSAACSSGCSGFDLLLGLEEGVDAGGGQQPSATIGSATAGNSDGLQGRGTAGASVEIPASGLSLPVLRARAESSGADWVGGIASGIQAYQFTGTDGTAVNLDVNLTGTVNNLGGSNVTGLEVSVYVLKSLVPFTFPADPTPVTDLVAQIIADGLLGGYDPFLAELSWDAPSNGNGAIDRSTTTTDPEDQLQFVLDNGDEFYLMAGLTAGADGAGASALSWSTLTLAFDTNDLQAASTVPLPAGLWLFGSAVSILLISGQSRRRNRG